MRRLTLDNFITLKDVDIDLKGFTILIGPQASGKSILAKLVYFFSEFATDAILDAIRDNSKKAELDKALVAKFKDLFFEDSWKNEEFRISFHYSNSHGIVVSKTRERSSLKIELLGDTKSFFTKAKNSFQRFLNEIPEHETHVTYKHFSDFKFSEMVNINNGYHLFNFNAYIPATRSLFSLYSSNFFVENSETHSLDIMSKEFAAIYGFAKQVKGGKLSNSALDNIRKENEEKEYIYELIEFVKKRILNGEHKIIEDDDYIKTNESLLALKHTSSGQQESLPLLMCLHMMTYFWRTYPQNYYVEEPEAHLFPEAQYDMVKFLALLAGCFGKQRYIVTTHSPYILSAINNLLYVYKIGITDKGRDALEKSGIETMVGIDFKTLSAYAVRDGKVISILDEENELIDAEMIDSVSSTLNDEFDALLDIAFED
ncbi:hypothetical protein SE23_20520 [Vibrio sinaloensis]|uniref:AAA family ATPase n=1 Tax=Photobacterium sp. (strain ATCC 43367) TaxID=379097 RepID=UPI00057FDFF2|nr:AAA family ATPase [Vibrio sinaloensis]KIE18741.1 hypothetical protein SE23_20520 [Vibrio sinaloensis]